MARDTRSHRQQLQEDDDAVLMSGASESEGVGEEVREDVGAGIILRGLRAVADFEYEFQMGLANKDLSPEIETLFLLTGTETVFVSSSIIKEIASGGRPVDRYVPRVVAEALYLKFPSEAT